MFGWLEDQRCPAGRGGCRGCVRGVLGPRGRMFGVYRAFRTGSVRSPAVPFSASRSNTWSPLLGIAASIAVLTLTAALLLIDLDHRRRSVERQLDVAGQSVVESVHTLLGRAERLLIRMGSDDDEQLRSERMDHLLLWNSIVGVGTSERPDDGIVWIGESGPARLGDEAITDVRDEGWNDVYHASVGDRMLIAHPRSWADGEPAWDVVLIDMARLVDAVIPQALEQAVEWRVEPVPAESDLELSEPLIHREYLILDGSTSWLFEFEMRDEALAAQSVGLSLPGMIVGVTTALLLGYLASNWIRRRYVEAEMRAAKELLSQKDILFLAISHQLRTPLTAVIGFLGLALEESRPGSTPDETEEMTRLALENAQEVSSLIEDLLVAARIQDQTLVISPRPVDLASLIRGVFEATRRPAEALILDDRAHGSRALADPTRVRQLVRKVFEKGRLDGAQNWSVTLDRTDSNVELLMEVDADLSETAAPHHYGDVAGPRNLEVIVPSLDIARLVAEMMGGRLTVTSCAGVTQVKLAFPLADEPDGRLDEEMALTE